MAISTTGAVSISEAKGDHYRMAQKKGGGSKKATIKEKATLAPEDDAKAKPLDDDIQRKSAAELKDEVFKYCFDHNLYYDPHLLSSILNDSVKSEQLPGSYKTEIEAHDFYKGKTFFSQLTRDGVEQKIYESTAQVSLTDEDKKNRQQILEIVGYDPFVDDASEDKPQLYRDLVGMLTESMRRDIPKQKAAIQIVHNYATIEHYQRLQHYYETIPLEQHEMGGKNGDIDLTQEHIDNCIQMASKTQDTILKLTKENGFSSGKSIGANGRGGLSDVMKFVEERGYDKGKVNFYDIKTSSAIQQVADISFKSLMNQVSLQSNEWSDICIAQAEAYRECRKQLADALEANRMLSEKITKQKLLDEYLHELVGKGIDLNEAQDIVDRQITLYEGNDSDGER